MGIGRHQHRARIVFLEANGPGPWPCVFCGELVSCFGRKRYDGNIHHVDGDKDNDAPENLAMTHVLCHQRYHNAGKTVSAETRTKMSAAFTGRVFSDEHRKNISLANRGKKRPHTKEHHQKIAEAHRGMKRSAESRQRMSDAQRAMPRFGCGDCSLVTTSSALYKHQKATGHAGKIEGGTS